MSIPKSVQQKNKKTMWLVLSVAVLMFGFAFLMVPFYNVMCKAIGINGKFDLQAGAAIASTSIDYSREVEVIFLATNNERLPWTFKPTQTKIILHPGEDKRIGYFAQNNSGRRMTVQAVPSVFPGNVARHIQKTECFCFTQQTFDDGEAQEMPLILRVDQELPKQVKTIVLSYTLFDASNFIGKVPTKIPGHIN